MSSGRAFAPQRDVAQGCSAEPSHPHGSAGEISTWGAAVGDKIPRSFQLSSQKATRTSSATTSAR